VTRSRDDRLETVRRADWRFLLPCVRPERVAVVGPAPGSLLAALRETMGKVTLLADASDASLRYDLVVVAGTRLAGDAARLLAKGGSLYWETPPGLDLARARAELDRAGLADIRAHWHYPDFEACREIVPLDHDEVVDHVLRGGAHGVKGEVKRAAARWIVRFGRREVLARHRSLLALRPGRVPADPSPSEHLRRSVSTHGRHGALLVKTPRFRASAHVLLFAFPPGGADPARVAKMPRLAGDPTLDREVECLRALETAGTRGVPRVEARRDFGGVATLVETVVPGRPLHPSRLRKGGERHVAAGVEWITDFHERTLRPAGDPRAWWKRFGEEPLKRLEAVVADAPGHELVQRTRALVRSLREAALPTVFEHGDIGAPNLLLDDAGSFGVVDWELGRPDGLVGADLFFFLGFAAVAREGAGHPEGFARAFRRAFLGPDAWARPWMRAYFDRLPVPPALRKPLFVLAAARVVDDTIGRLREERPPARDDREFLAWLRRERSFVLWTEAVRSYHEIALGPEDAPR